MNLEREQYREFVDLIYEHQRILHRLCSVYATQPEDREDLYQEMVMQAWRSFTTYGGHSQFSTWLYRVALNTALLARRKDSANRGSVSSSGQTPEAAVQLDTAPQEDVDLLYSCIQELSKVDRAIILLHLEHHTYKEIAEITGLSSGNVSVRIVRIKEKLRRLLLGRGYREE